MATATLSSRDVRGYGGSWSDSPDQTPLLSDRDSHRLSLMFEQRYFMLWAADLVIRAGQLAQLSYLDFSPEPAPEQPGELMTYVLRQLFLNVLLPPGFPQPREVRGEAGEIVLDWTVRRNGIQHFEVQWDIARPERFLVLSTTDSDHGTIDRIWFEDEHASVDDAVSVFQDFLERAKPA